MNFSLRNRIAVFYMTATAAISLLLFFVIFQVVHKASYDSIDNRLKFETDDVIDDIDMARDIIFFTDTSEWTEQEHKAVEVYPTFIEVVDINGKVIRKTTNLKELDLQINRSLRNTDNFDTKLADKPVRQSQTIILNAKGNILGFVAIAMPMEGTEYVISSLKTVLIYSYPVVLVFVFLISRSIAGRSIKPLQSVIQNADEITNLTLSSRIAYPQNKDEIYKLTETINGLMDRLEDAVLREKQFTGDASHELRTPLAIIKGTLEVLIRKPRDTKHYEEKISYCMKEVDRISELIDQLLMLARYESGSLVPIIREIDLTESVNYVLLRYKEIGSSRSVEICFDEKRKIPVKADPAMLDVILENLVSNSIKYSGESNNIEIEIQVIGSETTCTVTDHGIGMKQEQLARIFDRFYRSEEARSSEIGGHGIGLAIVKRLADVQSIQIKFDSEPGKGTTASLKFMS